MSLEAWLRLLERLGPWLSALSDLGERRLSSRAGSHHQPYIITKLTTGPLPRLTQPCWDSYACTPYTAKSMLSAVRPCTGTRMYLGGPCASPALALGPFRVKGLTKHMCEAVASKLLGIHHRHAQLVHTLPPSIAMTDRGREYTGSQQYHPTASKGLFRLARHLANGLTLAVPGACANVR